MSSSLLARFASRFDSPDLRVAPTSTLTIGGLRVEVLAGLTVALALVPEAVAFAFVAKVDPLVGLYAAFIVGLITALIGGRPGMISGATGALAVVMVSLVTAFPPAVGVQYLFLTVILMGLMQIFVGIMRWGKFIRLVPHPVMLGFVNGLAIVIGKAQLDFFKTADGTWMSGGQLVLVLSLVALTMLVIWGMPKITNAIPAPLAGIAITAGVVIIFGLPVPNVGDLASISGGLPSFALPDVPLNWETLEIILPYALILAAIGLIESLLTLNLVGEITGQRGGASQECIAQGAANTVTGFFGGMGGCAMIGQSMINVKSGGRTRISGISAALFLLAFILVASPLIEQIPLAALVGVMFMVVIGTFAWNSLKILLIVPRVDAVVIILVTAVTVRFDLAIAVIVGVIVSALAYAWQNARRIHAKSHITPEGAKVYAVQGPLFFGSATGFVELFKPKEDPAMVIIDFADSRVADQSALQAIEAVAAKYEAEGKAIQLRHLTRDCHRLLTKAGHLMVDSDDDPDYAVAANYGVRTGILGSH
ncbi:SulP family inorganic anion transporter [Jannaschia pohangensis]|uniref:Sulfate permease, SulP family n=1 Tax=Jannaschia pohangensis TaxID=390807 RepID=A0A1I3QEK0_9RHOB|nr:SulP family inorganic anion transporter [Jannaschia pohangensis]SFJ32180.1 sulfate permease, SulP family [Jannaschia pohangensis]